MTRSTLASSISGAGQVHHHGTALQDLQQIHDSSNLAADSESTSPLPTLHRANSAPIQHSPSLLKPTASIRHQITFSERFFDTKTLPTDLQRVYQALASKYDEGYALTVVFVIRTAIELHRAWHMTLLTHQLLQQLKDRFGLKMTWNLGVIHLIFRVDDGAYELHRKVPYDYDAEFQDLYMKIAAALIEGRISIHEALLFQAETKMGLHTAKSGLFLRNNPGRLVLYPVVSATCAIIFFGGDWEDAGVALACGLASGLVEYGLSLLGKDASLLTDVCVGTATGLVGGLFYRLAGEDYCLSAIFLGTLYWFFYGTAFVIGLLEIFSGELETGVTRFVAVSVKTFVLTLGATMGLQLAMAGGDNVFQTWITQDQHCNRIDLGEQWWRIPIYLLCSASVLGQYRAPIVHYWRGLIVQLVGYEVQYQMFAYFGDRHARDFLDTAVSNILGAIASVLTASLLSHLIDVLGEYYNARVLQRQEHGRAKKTETAFGKFMYNMTAAYIRFSNSIGLGKESSLKFLNMEPRLREQARELHDPAHPRQTIHLDPSEEQILVEAIVDAENLNIWALLMPAVYQLVPGSLIAKLWFNAVFPPPLVPTERTFIFRGESVSYTDVAANPIADDVFYGLWVISTSLALGLLIGFAIVRMFSQFIAPHLEFLWKESNSADLTEEEQEEERERERRKRQRMQCMLQDDAEDDPDEVVLTRVGQDKKTVVLGADRLQRLQQGDNTSSTPVANRQPVMDKVEEGNEDEDEEANGLPHGIASASTM